MEFRLSEVVPGKPVSAVTGDGEGAAKMDSGRLADCSRGVVTQVFLLTEPKLVSFHKCTCTMYSEQYMYSGFLIIRTPIIRIRTFGRRLTSPCFRYQREKDVAVTGVLPQEKAKLLYERLS